MNEYKKGDILICIANDCNTNDISFPGQIVRFIKKTKNKDWFLGYTNFSYCGDQTCKQCKTTSFLYSNFKLKGE